MTFSQKNIISIRARDDIKLLAAKRILINFCVCFTKHQLCHPQSLCTYQHRFPASRKLCYQPWRCILHHEIQTVCITSLNTIFFGVGFQTQIPLVTHIPLPRSSFNFQSSQLHFSCWWDGIWLQIFRTVLYIEQCNSQELYSIQELSRELKSVQDTTLHETKDGQITSERYIVAMCGRRET
jgi:hypothetical protein